MSQRRLEAVVIGRGSSGLLKIEFGRGRARFVMDVPTERIPPPLRIPSSHFVALVAGRDFVRVEPFGDAWVEIEDRIRTILNTDWDPIGVAQAEDDEYDGYIAGILTFLVRGAGVDGLAEHLRSIEVERMGLGVSPQAKLIAVAEGLRAIRLPDEPFSNPPE